MALFRLAAIDLRTIVASSMRCHMPREAPMVRNEFVVRAKRTGPSRAHSGAVQPAFVDPL
jgi:hypothetical protein